MAIKFVDTGPEDDKSKKPPAPKPEKLAGNVQADPLEGQLPFAKSDPKPRGRKKPLK